MKSEKKMEHKYANNLTKIQGLIRELWNNEVEWLRVLLASKLQYLCNEVVFAHAFLYDLHGCYSCKNHVKRRKCQIPFILENQVW